VGESISYYENGQINCQYYYKNGFINGPAIFYWENGQLRGKGNFVDGKEKGSWEYYDFYGTPTNARRLV
jgi:antitoxin component YwqK of YwqJK toxin-antitoxin module